MYNALTGHAGCIQVNYQVYILSNLYPLSEWKIHIHGIFVTVFLQHCFSIKRKEQILVKLNSQAWKKHFCSLKFIFIVDWFLSSCCVFDCTVGAMIKTSYLKPFLILNAFKLTDSAAVFENEQSGLRLDSECCAVAKKSHSLKFKVIVNVFSLY